MIKLYMKQKVFSFRDRFTIKDQEGNDKYFVSGSILSFGKKFIVADEHGQEVARIEQKIPTLLPKFTLFINNRETAVIEKKLSLFKQKYEIQGLAMAATGDFLAMNFTLSSNQSTIATVKKAWFTWGDSYEISINQEGDELLVLCFVLAIDYISHNESGSTSSD